MAGDYIQIGRIANTHGVKGEMKIIPLTNDIYRFDHLKIAFLGEEKIKETKKKLADYKKRLNFIGRMMIPDIDDWKNLHPSGMVFSISYGFYLKLYSINLLYIQY